MPFTAEQFFKVFEIYNAQIWPIQIVAYGLGIVAMLAFAMEGRYRARTILVVLAAMWIWNGIVYHFMNFAKVNPLAWLFGAAFIAQGFLLGIAATNTTPPRFFFHRNATGVVATLLIFYSMIIYPAIGWFAGHGGLAGPVFGVAPCPTTIFTLGFLMLTDARSRLTLAVIPLAWAAVGLSASVMLGVPEDLGLAAAAIALIATHLIPAESDPLTPTNSGL